MLRAAEALGCIRGHQAAIEGAIIRGQEGQDVQLDCRRQVTARYAPVISRSWLCVVNDVQLPGQHAKSEWGRGMAPKHKVEPHATKCG